MPRSIVAGGSCFILLTAVLVAQSAEKETFGPEDLDRALALHRESIVIDSHSDVTPRLEDPRYDFASRHPDGHMDIPRLRDAAFGAEFFSIYMGETPGEGRATRKALQRIDALMETIRRHDQDLELALTAADVRRIHAAGRIACLMGIEGGHIIEDSLANLRSLQRLGCRYMTLTHSFNTSWADAAGVDSDTAGAHGGLTDFGRSIVLEMNRLGMMVDLSHVADSTFRAAMATTTAPPIASHSSARAIAHHRRNLDDDMLRAMAAKDGVVMINFYCGFIDEGHDGRMKAWEAANDEAIQALSARFKANLEARDEALDRLRSERRAPRSPLVQLARHVEHVARIAGWRHVGIGADWDGVPSLPEGIDHCGDLPRLTALLLARGARPEDLKLFLGENILRVMAACEARAREIAAGR